MSTARIITDMGAAVALVGGKVKLSGLDRLPADIAERVLAVARERREELRRELDPTGLGWVTCPPEFDADKYGSQWAAFDLADLCHLYALRVVRAGERILATYPPALAPELIAYASELLSEARDYLRQHLDKLPILTPAEAVTAIMEIMRQHKGLKFTRGTDASIWPVYPRHWSAGQKATVQALWLVAGDALNRDDFEGVGV